MTLLTSVKDYAQLKEQREVDRRTIEELKAAKDAIGVEHDKVADVCRGLQQLLDTTNALLKRTVSEMDGCTQKAEEATALRVKAEEVRCFNFVECCDGAHLWTRRHLWQRVGRLRRCVRR